MSSSSFNGTKVDDTNLGVVWGRVAQYVKKITGDVNVKDDGTLQAQIMARVKADTDLAAAIEEVQKAIKDVEEEADNSIAASNRYVRDVVEKVQADLSEVAFQLALKDMIDSSGLKNITVDLIDSKNAVTLASGLYADGKVYI